MKDFSIGYFGDSRSGLLPVIKTEPQQEEVGGTPPTNSSSDENSSSLSEQGGQGGDETQNKPVFSARETALFVHGRWKETLTEEETFAVNMAIGKLRLASYSVDVFGETCTLTIKRNNPKLRLIIGKDGKGEVKVSITVTAGIADFSKALAIKELSDVGDVPDGVFAAAEKKLAATLNRVYEKARGVGCDVFGLQERLVKYKQRKYHKYKDVLLDNISFATDIKFRNVR